MPSPKTRACPACGTLMPASFPEGLCPKCLLAAAVGAPAEGAGSMARAGELPGLETLRGLFPELEILEVLGAGGMGAVYKARQPRLNRLVALKIMVAAPGHEADFALRFEREAQVLARLNHPHIVILHDFGELGPERTGADPLFYFLMEYVDGTDLGQLIQSRELRPDQALAIVPQICEALQYAHDQGITHRDIKPANILIDKKGTVKIADFGLAKMAGGAGEALMTGLTQTGTAMGTPHYMAPEQWEHPDQVDHRADIYALGVVFYEMLTGERPAGVFEPPSRKTSPPVDKKLDGVVLRALNKDPERRYQQAGEIRDEVTRISGANKRKPAANGDPNPRSGPLKPLVALGAAAALAGGGWMLWQGREDEPPSAAAAANATTAPGEPGALPETARPRVTGRLRGRGVHLDGKPVDLTDAEGISDFVQVILTDKGWVGLRANGEEVTPEDGWETRNVARLLPGWFNSYGTIDRNGRLNIRRLASEGVKAVPEEVQRIGVVDACWEEGQAIALLRDGSARVWGEHYTSAHDGQPVWPAPPAEALRDVRRIAITHWRAATLGKDGRLRVWGGHGGGSGPFDLEPFARWGEIADIQSGYEPFRVLTRGGLVFNLGGSRPLSSGLVAEDIEAIHGNLLLPKGASVWGWIPRTRSSAQAEGDALLKKIGHLPRDAFDIRASGENEGSRIAAVWIEPVR